jgi:ferredoxin
MSGQIEVPADAGRLNATVGQIARVRPDEYTGRRVCEPESRDKAMVPGSGRETDIWTEMNRESAALWPNITRKGIAFEDTDARKSWPDKVGLLSAEPGTP